MHMDPRTEVNENDQARVKVIRLDKDGNGAKVKTVVHEVLFGPPDEEDRETFKQKFQVKWDNADSHHVIDVYSESENDLSFTLAAQKQTSLSKNSVLVAALIMVGVYIFILIEVIHRTLVAIFGSMVALFFFFMMRIG